MPTFHVLERSQVIPRPRAEVFAFFADPRNLEPLTPPFLHFEVVTPVPPAVAAGTILDYRLRLFGVPLHWRTRIEEVDAERRFVDVQIHGPYALWEHTHTFDDVSGGTLVGDRVRYALPLSPVGEAAHPLFVRPTLDRIFDYRRERISALLALGAAAPPGGWTPAPRRA